jgi:predicted membrane protein
MGVTTDRPPFLPQRRQENPAPLDLGRALLGLVIVTVGTLFLLQSADVLDAGETIGRWWPTLIVAAGIIQIIEATQSYVGPLVLIAAGTLLLLATTGVLPGNSWDYVWPTVLIIIGLTTLVRWGRGDLRRASGDDAIVATGVFGGPTLVSASQAFRTASLTAVFGGVTLDLRDARPAPDGARISATAAFGGVDILVPEGWRISVTGTPIFGGVEDSTRHSAHLPDDAPTLIVDALVIFGGVEITHGKTKD